jgi:hypothetical protein
MVQWFSSDCQIDGIVCSHQQSVGEMGMHDLTASIVMQHAD